MIQLPHEEFLKKVTTYMTWVDLLKLLFALYTSFSHQFLLMAFCWSLLSIQDNLCWAVDGYKSSFHFRLFQSLFLAFEDHSKCKWRS